MNEWEWRLLEEKGPLEEVRVPGGARLQKGDRVRLHPRKQGDAYDLALTGKAARIESIEQDYEGVVHVAVVVDDDPGREAGLLRQPAHRFFFAPDEIEPLENTAEASGANRKEILIAGIGNIFLGDDAFGVEVAKRLSTHCLPAETRVVDFGIRGYDLAYALLAGQDLTILVDACPRGTAPGSLYVIEPDLESLDLPASMADAHGMDPLNVLRLAKSLGGPLGRIVLVGCEPDSAGRDGGEMGMSEPVTFAVEEAAKLIEDLVAKFLEGDSQFYARRNS